MVAVWCIITAARYRSTQYTGALANLMLKSKTPKEDSYYFFEKMCVGNEKF
jgi:hypothetical protein